MYFKLRRGLLVNPVSYIMSIIAGKEIGKAHRAAKVPLLGA